MQLKPRTEEEKHLISLKMSIILAKDIATLWHGGEERAAQVVMEYLANSDDESLVLLYDILSIFDAHRK